MKKLDFENTFRNKKVLIAYPHPDDEVFSVGGLMQRLISEKIDFMMVCLTKGEASTLKFGLNETDRLDQKREGEYEAVMKYIGVEKYKIENFPDKKLREIPNDIRQYFIKVLEDYKPDVMMTYEPCGIYGHPDHIFVSEIITELAQALNLRLIYTTTDPKFKIPEEMLTMADNPDQIKPIYPTHVMTLTLKEFVRKIKAWGLHESQTNNVKSNKFEDLIRALIFRKEYFHIVE